MTLNDFKLTKRHDGSVVVQREHDTQRIHFLSMRAALEFIVCVHVEERTGTQQAA